LPLSLEGNIFLLPGISGIDWPHEAMDFWRRRTLENQPKQDLGAGHQTRREFIRNVLVKTAYAAPVIATFSVSNVSAASSFSFMISKKKSPSPMMSPSMMGSSGMGSSGMMKSSGKEMLWS
jgi:hypothetical protein